MSLRIQNNVEAFNAHRQPRRHRARQLSKSMERLSSGYRINRAADDAAGLAISEKLRAQIGGLDQAQRNAQDAVSLVQTGEGAMAEVHSMLQRVRDLAVQFNNGTLSRLGQGVDHRPRSPSSAPRSRPIGANTKFNGIALLTGSSSDHLPGRRRRRPRRSTVSAVALFGSGSSFESTRRSSRFSRHGHAGVDRLGDPERRRRPRRPSARCRTGSSTR